MSHLHQVAKVLEFQHQPSSEYSGLISLRMDWLDLLAVQGTLKSPWIRVREWAEFLHCSRETITALLIG